MKPKVLSSIALMTLLSCETALAQDGVANISGTWQMDPNRSETFAQAPEARPKTSVRLVIKQSPAELQIERQRDGQSTNVAYSFYEAPVAGPTTKATDSATADRPVGTAETVASEPAGPDFGPTGVDVTKSRFEWKDGRLMLMTVLTVNGKAVTSTEALTLSADGRELIVETVLQIHHGYETPGASGKGKDIYVRATE
jgi:hypothetical protein